jgi:hypothetical protein
MEFFEVAGSSMIENIPFETMAPRLLEQSLMHERLKLAMCSTRLLQLITNEFAELWIHIGFMPFKELRLTRVLEKRNAKLTDKMFATLLTSVLW